MIKSKKRIKKQKIRCLEKNQRKNTNKKNIELYDKLEREIYTMKRKK